MKCSSEIVFLVLLAFGYGVHGGRDVTSKMCKKHDVMNVDANGRMQSVVEHTGEDLEATRTDGAQMQKGTPKSSSEDIIEDIFDRYDVDKDDQLSKAELRQYCADLNDMEDVEKDGAQMQEGTPKSTSQDLEEDGAQMQEETPKSTSEDADSTNSFLDTDHTLSLAEKAPSLEAFELPASTWKCCCKETPKYFICKRGKDAGIKIAPITTDGKQLCCKARSGRCDVNLPGVGGYKHDITTYTLSAGQARGLPRCYKIEGVNPKDHEEFKGITLQRQRSFNCSIGPSVFAGCAVPPPDKCRASNVRSVGCKGIVKAFCFFTQVLDGIIPGVRDTGVFNNVVKTALDKTIIESEEAASFAVDTIGEAAVGGLYAGTGYGILTMIFNACQGNFGSCNTGSKAFGVAVGITCIVLVLTGAGIPVVYLTAAVAGPLIAALGEDICNLGWKCAAEKYIGTPEGFKANMERFLKDSLGGKVAQILTYMATAVGKLLDFAIHLMKTLLFSVLKLVYGILAFLPRVGMYAVKEYQGRMRENATEANRQLCCFLQRPVPEDTLEDAETSADKIRKDHDDGLAALDKGACKK